MTVVFLVNSLFTAVNFRKDLLQSLHEKKIKLVILTPITDGDTKYFDFLKDLEASVVQLPLSRNSSNFFLELWTIVKIWQALQAIRPDIVLNFTLKPFLYGSLLSYLLPTPKIFSTITGVGHLFTGNGIKIILLKYLLWPFLFTAARSNNGIIFQNPDDVSLFKKFKILGNCPYLLVGGSGVDLDAFNSSAARKKKYMFLMVARILVSKGINEYAKAVSLIRKNYPNIRCALVGGFDTNAAALSRNELALLIKQSGVEYLGESDDVAGLLAQSTVFVLPSYREGCPRAALEALAAGLPVVTTDVPGCRETAINGHNGFLVQVKDVDSLFFAMRNFIEDADLAIEMGKRSRQLAELRFDVKKVNNEIMNFIF